VRRHTKTWIMAGLLAGVLAAPQMAAAEPRPAAPPPDSPPDSQFQKVTLNDRPGEPMDLAVLPDGRVLHTTRAGVVWLHDPDSGLNTKAATLDVYQHDEEGLQSIALDPKFDGRRNTWVYLYYSPPMDTPVDDPETPDVNEGDAPFTGDAADWERFAGLIRLSRFKLEGDELDLGSEQQILDVPVDRGICCHVGGDIVFDDHGNLYLSTGDDTNPFESDGYAPIDERARRNPAFDAQRSSANTNDLRGKILRIRPKSGGGYKIPDGNLFPEGTPKTRPEIYAMGLRNPFRIEFDQEKDRLFVGDYSPDAGEPDPQRGPAGTGRWTVLRRAANYGWPYCATPAKPYIDYDFATSASGKAFNCDNPVNESPHNTGRVNLPSVTAPTLQYGYGESAQHPELGTGGIGPMGGPAYDYNARVARRSGSVAWPRYYDGVPLFYEWTRDYIKGFHLGRDGVRRIDNVIPSITTDNPMDLEFGSDGALYMLEYGDGFFAENPEAQVARIDFIGKNGNHSPQPQVSANPTNGLTPLAVSFSSDGTKDQDGDRLRYAWDFDEDGRVDSRQQDPTWTYDENGVYNATLNVTDSERKSAAASVEIIVGNEKPEVTLVEPVAGQPFAFGDTVRYEVQVTDDQAVDCSEVSVTYILGHDEHGHPQTTQTGCTGSIKTTVPSGHDPGEDHLTAVFDASYSDPGGDGVPSLSGGDEVVLEPTN
jgi:cytochrome c